jgi:hypothetical protein
MIKLHFLLLSIAIFTLTSALEVPAETYKGVVVSSATGKPVEYVNIGVVGKGIGTVANHLGQFQLDIPHEMDNDTLLFSCIGYAPYAIRVAEYRYLDLQSVALNEHTYELNEVVVRPRSYRPKRLGVFTRTRAAQAGFDDNLLGYECGVPMRIKKSAILDSLHINFSSCTYDSIFYRVNIYRINKNVVLNSILNEPIYLVRSNEDIKRTVTLDLTTLNLVVDGDILVTVEHIRNHGKGHLYFSTSLRGVPCTAKPVMPPGRVCQ